MSDRSRVSPQPFADRNRIERELGAGGMATVDLAHDVKLSRHRKHPDLIGHIPSDILGA